MTITRRFPGCRWCHSRVPGIVGVALRKNSLVETQRTGRTVRLARAWTRLVPRLKKLLSSLSHYHDSFQSCLDLTIAVREKTILTCRVGFTGAVILDKWMPAVTRFCFACRSSRWCKPEPNMHRGRLEANWVENDRLPCQNSLVCLRAIPVPFATQNHDPVAVDTRGSDFTASVDDFARC